MRTYLISWQYREGYVSASTAEQATAKAVTLWNLRPPQLKDLRVMPSPVKLYNLLVKSTGKWLSRWPSTAGAPALYSYNREDAVEFQLDPFQWLAGYMDYFRTDCTCVLVGYTPELRADLIEQLTCEGMDQDEALAATDTPEKTLVEAEKYGIDTTH